MWKVWKYALGSFQDETTQKYDNIICVVRTFILLSYLVTNCFIVAGVIRHLNKQSWEENSVVKPGTCSQVSTKQKRI